MSRHRLAHAVTHALHLFFLLLDFDECSISELFTVIFTCLIFSKVEVGSNTLRSLSVCHSVIIVSIDRHKIMISKAIMEMTKGVVTQCDFLSDFQSTCSGNIIVWEEVIVTP